MAVLPPVTRVHPYQPVEPKRCAARSARMLNYISYAVAAVTALFVATVSLAEEETCDRERWYCADTLNPGLTTLSATVDRDTPRATIESFLNAARHQNWSDAAHLLDLSDVPEGDQARIGARLAERLETVISRKAVISWGALPDRPDGMDATAAADAPLAGQPRKSLLLWTVDLKRYPASIRLNRIRPDGGDPVWVFSRQTVQNTDALFALYGPTWFEAQLPEALKASTRFGLMWWEILGLPIVILLAFLCSRFVWTGLTAAKRRAKRAITREILRSARGPAAIGSATGIALAIGSNLFVFSGQISTVVTPAAWLGLMASGLWFAVNCIDVILDRLTEFDETDLTKYQAHHMRTVATRVAAARRALVVAVVLIGGGVFLSQTNVFQNLGLTLLGTAGALTLVLGFAARQVLGNIMASMQIALNQSARIGDRIVYKDYLCRVERINFTYVQLRDWDGTRLVVPVDEFISTPFENWTMQEPEMLRIIKLKCAHQADVDQLRTIFDRVVASLDPEELGDLDDAKVRVAGQDALGKDVWFALPCADPNTSWDMACKAREKLIAEATDLEKSQNIDIFPEARLSEAA